MRPQHILSENARNETPLHFIVVDTETLPRSVSDNATVHDLRIGAASYYRYPRNRVSEKLESFTFRKSAEFLDWVIAHSGDKSRLWVFAHNLSFDAQVLDLINGMKCLGYRLKFIVDECPPCVMKFTNGKRSIQFADTMNYAPVSLAKLGKTTGALKLPMPDFSDSDAAWLAYCQNDVHVLHTFVKAWIDYVRNYDLGCFSATIAGQAFNAFRHKHMTAAIVIHDKEHVCKIERDAYKGGRTECFYIGSLRGAYTLLDVNSMYPFVMSEYRYPIAYIAREVNPPLSTVSDALREHAVIARCTVRTETPSYAIRHNNKLIFPVGTFQAVLTSPELSAALARRELVSVQAAYFYVQAPLFESFVEFFYKQRQLFAASGDDTRAFMAKLMLNSLYGKFGQRGYTWEFVNHPPLQAAGQWVEVNADTGLLSRFRAIDGQVQMRREHPESFNSFPAIAAHVTAYARMHLDRLMSMAGRGNVFYCDTDSMLVNAAGLDHLQHAVNPDWLGALKIVGTYANVQLRGLKDYTFDSVTRHKGIRANAQQITPDTFRQEHFQSLKRSLNQGDGGGQRVYWVTKHLARAYDKGLVTANGRVIPYRF